MTTVVEATGDVVIVNWAVDAPADTVAKTGVCATNALLVDRLTSTPPARAGPVSLTVPTTVVPPRTIVDPKERVSRVDEEVGLTLSTAALEAPSYDAVRVTVSTLGTGVLAIAKFADV